MKQTRKRYKYLLSLGSRSLLQLRGSLTLKLVPGAYVGSWPALTPIY